MPWEALVKGWKSAFASELAGKCSAFVAFAFVIVVYIYISWECLEGRKS